jgi:hypothetical protein
MFELSLTCKKSWTIDGSTVSYSKALTIEECEVRWNKVASFCLCVIGYIV